MKDVYGALSPYNKKNQHWPGTVMIQKGPKKKIYIYRERESKSECSAGQKIINIKNMVVLSFSLLKDGPTFKVLHNSSFYILDEERK